MRGFSLDEIRALLRLGGPEKASCREFREIAVHHLEDIQSKLRDLKKLERRLAATVSRCSGRKDPDCPVLDILDIQRSQKATGHARERKRFILKSDAVERA